MGHSLRATHLRATALMLTLFVCMATPALAQDGSEHRAGTARKFDEFGQVGGCDHGARLDNFVIQLQNEPAATGYLIAYGPEGTGAGTGELRRQISENYLVNSRGLDPARFRTIYGGRYKGLYDSATELWIVPAGAEPPEPQSYANRAAAFTGLLAEYDNYDGLYAVGEGEDTGPAFGNSPLAGLADALRQQPDKVCYIVAFNSSEAAPGAWRRAAREASGAIEQRYSIAADRIKIIYGGYRQLKKGSASARVQLWVAPPDTPPVAAAQGPEPRPDKAVQIVSADVNALTDEENSRLAFEGFAELLKEDEQLKACIIIRLEVETEAVEDEVQAEEATESAEETDETAAALIETPRPDLIQLVEKWKSDLERKYGVSRDRLIVLTARAQEYQLTSLETWVVPPGAALPDPSIVEEEQLPKEGTGPSEDNPQQ